MKFDEIRKAEARYYSGVFSRFPVAVEKGRGMYVWDTDGRKYLDMFSGIAVNSVGHCHPKVVDAIKKQAETLIHVSNWYYTVPQVQLAEKLAKLTGQEKVFLTNDGTSAVETAIKLARKAKGKPGIIAMENAFHGRTLGSLSLTWGEKYKTPFKPLLDDVKFVPYNDASKVEDAITDKTAAVIVEPIQGEAGVLMPDKGYLKELRQVASDNDVLLIVDEVQTGFGRTGVMFAHQRDGIKPDILCLSKSMGSGLPIGAAVYSGFDFEPGEHGGTLIGNPVTCAAALATIEVIEEEKLVENSKRMGDEISKRLKERGIDCRGAGLMIGVPVKDGRKVVSSLIGEGVLAVYSKDTLRLLPPLIINDEHVDEFMKAFKKVMGW